MMVLHFIIYMTDMRRHIHACMCVHLYAVMYVEKSSMRTYRLADAIFTCFAQ